MFNLFDDNEFIDRSIFDLSVLYVETFNLFVFNELTTASLFVAYVEIWFYKFVFNESTKVLSHFVSDKFKSDESIVDLSVL